VEGKQMPLDGRFVTEGREATAGAAALSHARGRWTAGDLNYLFHRQQVEQSRAASAASAAARAVHGQFARLYENVIEEVTGGNIRFRHAPGFA
jgi:hypothetical protein